MKLYKALIGPDAPVNSDHIEGAGEGIHMDMNYRFSLMLGIGSVYQTCFWNESWRIEDPMGVGDKALYQKWFDLYYQLRLSQGIYLNLYDLVYDKPGSHAIAKGKEIYYLFAPPHGKSFQGKIELRGLDSNTIYSVVDYENNINLGKFVGPTIQLDVNIPINDPLLLKATPVTVY